MAADGEEVISVRNGLGGWVVEGGALEGEGAEEDVIECIPTEWDCDVALRDCSFSREEDVIRA